jgi:hypothetical protein
MLIPVNSLLIKDLTHFKGILTANFYPIDALSKNLISFFLRLKCSLLKIDSTKPLHSAPPITIKINGGTTIFNGVLALSIRNLFHFLFTIKKSSKWLRIISF